MINTKLISGAIAVAAALVTVTPALAGGSDTYRHAAPAVMTKSDHAKVELAHSNRGYKHYPSYGNRYDNPPPYAWKYKKHHNRFGWHKPSHKRWGWGYDRYYRNPYAWR
ncbi:MULTISPECIES: hypothetical protein [Hyphomicrobium]|jgi:hypothetical protein|uniref:hypothetical protein n=1 Tax=Hyphomicrobium TaxID=81 RepID=UPI00036D784D|nr:MULTISPECIES: hypothetical protein [Hyphomicrobium]WBT39918.1 hypothetical protein PE058_08545 [Hyphomicrobium sp. DMF-1]HML43262.1 hypothetical protein [Hyphomicrobium zavarzinii]